MIGIYMIKNIVDNKVYIGRSKSINLRFSSHKSNLRKNKHINKHLQNAWNKYGEDNFEFSVIEICETIQDTYKKEIFYIDKYKSCNRDMGYNLSYGGEGSGEWSEESKEKLRESLRFNNSNLKLEDVRRIKLAMYCNMDRKEISKMYNVSIKVLTQISIGASFCYVNEELNESIHNLKQKMINERNEHILNLFDEGYYISEICKLTEYTTSVVEKCVYKYRNAKNLRTDKYKEVFDNVHELYDKGYKKYTISKILNISPSTVSRYLSGHSNPYLELPYKKITDEKKSKIIDMFFNDDIEIKDIARKLQVSRNTIETYINQYKYANTEVTNLSNII